MTPPMRSLGKSPSIDRSRFIKQRLLDGLSPPACQSNKAENQAPSFGKWSAVSDVNGVRANKCANVRMRVGVTPEKILCSSKAVTGPGRISGGIYEAGGGKDRSGERKSRGCRPDGHFTAVPVTGEEAAALRFSGGTSEAVKVVDLDGGPLMLLGEDRKATATPWSRWMKGRRLGGECVSARGRGGKKRWEKRREKRALPRQSISARQSYHVCVCGKGERTWSKERRGKEGIEGRKMEAGKGQGKVVV